MKKSCAILLFSLPCFAADKPKVIEWNTDFPYSTVKYINGRAMEHLLDRGRAFDVYAPIAIDKHTYEVMVGIVNSSEAAIDVDPANMGGLSDDTVPLVIPSIDGAVKISKEDKSAHRWAAFGAALSAGAAAITQGNCDRLKRKCLADNYQ